MARLPKSTIVLAVATCIPFGLAIRDTAAGKYKLELSEREAEALERYGRDHDDDDEEDYRDVAARRELEEIENRKAIAEYEARQELERQERSERIKTLYSAEVAMMGTAFADIHLGDPAGKVTVESTPDAYLSLYDDGVATHSLRLQLHRYNEGDCELLAKNLRETWGEPKSRNNRWIWVNEPAQQRAIWSEGDCELIYERIATVDEWLGKSESSLIPLWAIGKPAKQLLDVLGERSADTVADDQISWPVRGLGVGRNPAQVVAEVSNGKVTSLFVSLEIDGDTLGALSERISKLVGKEPEIPSDRPDVELWKGRPTFKLEEGAPQTFLSIGGGPAVPGGPR